jgi:hypothetical protein
MIEKKVICRAAGITACQCGMLMRLVAIYRLQSRRGGQSRGGSANFPSARDCVNKVSMSSQETVITKKRGPKPTGKGQLIGVRMPPKELAALDAWIAQLPDPKPSRPEAIRIILRSGTY